MKPYKALWCPIADKTDSESISTAGWAKRSEAQREYGCVWHGLLGRLRRPNLRALGSSLPEIIEDGLTGLLCPQDDIQTFAEAARKVATDPILRR